MLDMVAVFATAQSYRERAHAHEKIPQIMGGGDFDILENRTQALLRYREFWCLEKSCEKELYIRN